MSLFDHERVLLKVRSHPIIFIVRSLLFITLGFVPLGLASVNVQELFGREVDETVLVLGLGIYYLYLALFLLFTFFDHHLDIWILTDSHVINVEQNSLFSRNVAKQELSRIQDVEAQIKGILPTIFNYGNVYIQTAGTEERITFTAVPNPRAIADTIIRLMDDARKEPDAPASAGHKL
ncbi:MAG: PH domain-containing protein [Patescibacteria group bacterium]